MIDNSHLIYIFASIFSSVICLTYAIYKLRKLFDGVMNQNLGITIELIRMNKFVVESIGRLDKRLSNLEDNVLIVKGTNAHKD